MPRGVFVRTAEARANMSAARLGKPISSARRAGMMGHPVSQETRARISAAQRRHWTPARASAATRAPHLRVLDRTLVGDGCWEFGGRLSPAGYGYTVTGSKLDGTHRLQLTHRVVYEALVGPIPEGLTLDHLCRNRACVRPDHLEPVTLAENKARGLSPAAVNARRTHCLRRHPFDEANTYVPPRGGRQCRACARRRAAQRAAS